MTLNFKTESDMNIYETNAAAVNAAKEHFSSKTERNFYRVNALNEDFLEEVCYHQEFSPEEVAQLRDLRAKYGEEEYLKHLIEVFEDEGIIHNLSGGDEIISIDLDSPMRKYRFQVRFFNEEKTYSRQAMVELSEDEYVRLLALRIDDNHMNMSVLRHIDAALHDKILKDVEWQCASDDGFLMCPDPFLVTMDEVNEDAEVVKGKHPEFVHTGFKVYFV